MAPSAANSPALRAFSLAVAAPPPCGNRLDWGTEGVHDIGRENHEARMASEGASERLGGERRGSIGLVLLVAVLLIGAATGLMFVGRDSGEPYVLALLAVLGTVGVF